MKVLIFIIDTLSKMNSFKKRIETKLKQGKSKKGKLSNLKDDYHLFI